MRIFSRKMCLYYSNTKRGDKHWLIFIYFMCFCQALLTLIFDVTLEKNHISIFALGAITWRKILIKKLPEKKKK